MSTELMSRDEAADHLRNLSLAATDAVRLPDDLAMRVLQRARRRQRLTRGAWGIGTVLAVAGSAAAVGLGSGDFYTVTQPSGAMEPTVAVGENVVLSKSATPRLGEVVHVRWTDGALTYESLSRVMGVEGDVVSCPEAPDGHCDAVLVNGKPMADPYLAGLVTKPFEPTTVPDDAFFLLGDNRGNAHDSRALGPVDEDAIEGVAVEIVDAEGEHRDVPGAPWREGPRDEDLIDPADHVPPGGVADPSGS